MPKTSPNKDEIGHVGFNAGKARKRALRMLSAKLDFPNETELLKALLDEKIEKYLPSEMKFILEEAEELQTKKVPAKN